MIRIWAQQQWSGSEPLLSELEGWAFFVDPRGISCITIHAMVVLRKEVIRSST
jgi:hypothetical protein